MSDNTMVSTSNLPQTLEFKNGILLFTTCSSDSPHRIQSQRRTLAQAEHLNEITSRVLLTYAPLAPRVSRSHSLSLILNTLSYFSSTLSSQK